MSAACNISQVDYVQLPTNLLSGEIDSEVSNICTKNKIKVIAYNILENGLLAGKLDKDTNFPKNDRRSRLPLFKGIEFINALNKVEELKIKAVENNSNLLQYSINWVLMQKNIASVIIGIKNQKQIVENCSAILN